MAYIGKTPTVGNFVKLDAISTSSTNSYSLLNGGVAFTPESANHMIVSLNGVIQAPSTAFSVSGSTITFLPSSGTLSSADTIDFILVLGNVLDIGTPSDSTVTNAKTNFVTTSSAAGLQIKGDNTTAGAIQLNCEQNSHGIKLQSPAHSANQSYTLKFPTGNVTAGTVLTVDSVTGSGTTGVGQLSFAGSMVKLLDATISSSVANYDIDSTYINSTYDTYRLEFELTPATDGAYTNLRVFVGGSVQTGSIYGAEASPTDGGTTYNNNTGTAFMLQGYTVGNADGEGITGITELKNVNSTTLPFHHMGYTVCHNSSGNHFGSAVTGSLRPANRGDVVNGLRLKFNSGNIESGRVKLYGIL